MRRIVLAASAAMMLMLSPAGAATPTKVSSHTLMGGTSGFNVFASSYESLNLATNQSVSNEYTCVGVLGMAADYGCGAVRLLSDPLAARATLTGTVPSAFGGTITFDLTFSPTRVSTSSPRMAELMANPTGAPPRAGVITALTNTGRIDGTVSSARAGLVTVTDQHGSLSSYTSLEVAA